MLKQALLSLSLCVPMVASAGVVEDMLKVRPLLPGGMDVAQLQVQILQGESYESALEYVKSNYILRDINADGITDLLVIAEENPRFENYDTNQPCRSESEPSCMTIYGKRSLMFFTGQADGNFDLAFANDKMVLAGDEGGVFGDPLEGLAVRPNGSITLSVYGGSSWRWSYTDVMQYRKGDLYIVGQDSYQGWTGDLRADTKSVNLITGKVEETHQEHAEAPIRKKVYRIPVKPLVKVSNYTGPIAE